jgi:tetratricopeptide (TPR) repeat protein
MRVSTAPTPASLTVQASQLNTTDPADVLLTVRAIADRKFQAADQNYQAGQLPEAQQQFTTALAYYTQAQETVGMGQSLNGLSAVYLELESFGKALACSQAAVAVLEETSATTDYAIALYQLGLSHRALHQPHQAERFLSQALELFEILGDAQFNHDALLHLGWAYAAQGKFAFALACGEAVLESLMADRTQANVQEQLKPVLSLMMQLCAQTKMGDAVRASLQTILTQHLLTVSPQQAAARIQQLGQFHESQEQYRLALECYAQALQTISPVAIA